MDATTLRTSDQDQAAPAQPAATQTVNGLAEVRPRLRHDVLFADMGDGVLFRNTDNGFIVKGRSAYRFAAALAPHLNGQHTVAEMTAGLGDAQQAMMTDFVRALLDKGFVRDSRPARPVELPEPVRARFHPQINYVEHYADDAAHRFAQFRAADVLVLGGGPISTAAALSLVRNGMQAVHLTTATAAADLTAAAAELAGDGCDAEVRLVARERLGAPELAAYDLVVAPAEQVGAAELLRLRALLAAPGPVLLPAATVGGLAVVGPLTRAGSAPCWTCALLRLGANLDPRAVAALWHDVALPGPAPSTPEPSAPLAAMLGNLLGYEAFRVLTGCMPAETDGAVVIQDLESLETSREKLLPHPGCPGCRDAQDATAVTAATAGDVTTAGVPGSADEDPDAPESLRQETERALELVAAHVGIVSGFDDTGLEQSPLKVTRLRLGPADHPGSAPRVIVAADLHYVPRARTRATHAAALAYVGQVAHVPAAAPTAVTPPGNGLPAVPHEQLLTWTGRPAGEGRAGSWVTAVSERSGRKHLVPAAAVFPFSRANADLLAEPTAAGNGAGATVADAVREGILSALAYAALRDAASGRTPVPVIQLTAPEHGSEIDFLLRTARNLQLTVELLDLAPHGPAHLVLARVADTDAARVPWTVGAALSRDAAVAAALRDLLAAEQLRTELGGDDLDFGDPLLPDLDARAVAADGTAAPRTDTTVRGLLDDLDARGLDALTVTTTTPDLRRHGGIVTVRVLLARRQG